MTKKENHVQTLSRAILIERENIERRIQRCAEKIASAKTPEETAKAKRAYDIAVAEREWL
jgi:hypothetical protein